jgi:C4-dicarboxylate-specific signal transduction histidine kinase
MAPEQAGGDPTAVGPAADTYALGAILYECLTGRPPFKAATAMETVLQVLHNEPVPPSQLQPGLPRDLETVCLKCLRKDPAGRYPSALELADDLRRWLDGEPIRARPVSPAARLWRWCRRNPVVAGLLVLVGLSLAVSFLNLRASLASVERLARHNQLLLAQSLARQLDERVRSNTQAVALLSREAEVRALLAAAPARRRALLPAAMEALRSVLWANEDFSSAFVLDAAGTALASTNPAHPGRSYAFRDYFQQAVRGRTYRSKVLVGTSTRRPGMYYSAPVREGGKVLGVVVVKLEAEALWRIVEGLDVGEKGAALLVDEDGIVIAHRDRSLLYHSVAPLTEEDLRQVAPRLRFQSDTVSPLGVPALAALRGAGSAGTLDYVEPAGGTRRAVAYAPLREKPWVVATDLDARDFSGEKSLLARRGAAGIAAVAGVLAVVLAGLFVRRLLRARAGEAGPAPSWPSALPPTVPLGPPGRGGLGPPG